MEKLLTTLLYAGGSLWLLWASGGAAWLAALECGEFHRHGGGVPLLCAPVALTVAIALLAAGLDAADEARATWQERPFR